MRYHSPERVVAEIGICVDKYNTEAVTFSDDNFTLKKERAAAICEALLRKNIKIKWGCLARADSLDKDLLKTMKNSGCTGVTIGVETGSEAMRLKVLKKGIKDRDILNVKKWCDELGIESYFFFMAGFPGETRKELDQTLGFARKVKTVFFANSVTICYPGTEIWDMAVREKKYPADYWHRIARGEEESMPFYYPDGFSREEFLELTKRYVYKYILDPRYVPIALGYAMESWQNFTSMLFYFREFMKHLFRKFVLKKKAVLH